jgi:adenosyl cobinamide kinase/adenosyl cobinamide phosphate guanylyltransferase
MQMLMLRPHGQRANGTPRRVPIVRERGRKFGPILSERALSVRQDLLITGANSSGKTRWLAKLDDKAPEVWPDKEKIFIRAMEPLQRWYDDPRVAAHMVAKGKAWDKLKTYERIDALVDWVKSTRAVVLLDDAHKLAGRKLDIAIQLCREAGRLVVGAWAENNISMSLRMLIDKRDPQRVPLDSEAAYDVTQMAMWLLILAAMGAGWWQLAAVVGGMKVLAGGRRAARQT